MSKVQPLDKPTRQGVNELFRELKHVVGYSYASSKASELDKDLDKLRERLLNVPEYRDLEQRISTAREEWRKYRQDLKTQIDKVQRKFLAEGLTDQVRKELSELVEWVNSSVPPAENY